MRKMTGIVPGCGRGCVIREKDLDGSSYLKAAGSYLKAAGRFL